MTNEELVKLIQKGIEIEKNITELYEQNRNFIYKIALPYSKTCDIDDLMQEAYFGLSDAVKDYSPEKEYLFLTYAKCRIKGVIQRYYYNCGRTRRFPAHIIQLISKYQGFKNAFRSKCGNNPTEKELLKGLNINKKQLSLIEKCVHEFCDQSIDDVIPGTNKMTVSDVVADEYDFEEDITDRMVIEQDNATIWNCVNELDDRRQEIIRCRYKQRMSLSNVAEQEHISGERIRQLERNALMTLKKKKQIQDVAMRWGYNCKQAYHYGLQRFKDTGISSTEFIALNRICE